MFTASIEHLHEARVRRYEINASESRLSYREVLGLWQTSEAFREFFLSLLYDSPYLAFRWETPPVAFGSLDRRFEFVLVDSPELDRVPARDAFAEHFPSCESPEGIVCFDNLGGDAGLVVPCPHTEDYAYVHLANFVRRAPVSQQHALWRAVGAVVEERLSDRPLWLSTAGGGVAWLHVRLDSRPKYYSYGPYRSDSR